MTTKAGQIVCATRGGEGSRAAQLHAIRAAQDGGVPLTFLYVVDVNMLAGVDEKLVDAVRAELQWLGGALLRVAKQRAEQVGVDVSIVILEGVVRDEIVRYIRANQASLLLLGAPRGTTSRFGDDAIELFAHAIEQESGTTVHVVRPEELV